jgi:teichuronic acid biosynthesis glycosyltransferase TuaG
MINASRLTNECKPTFSVVIPFRNAASTIGRTIDSIVAQTLPSWEALFIDDASNDGGLSIVLAHAAREPRIKAKSSGATKPRGVAETRNLGLEAATGEFIAFLDADDTWLPGKLEAQLAAFAAGADIVFSSYERVDDAGRVIGIVSARPVVAWSDALAGNPIGCLTAAYRRQRFPLARMSNIGLHEDYAFWLDMLRENGTHAIGLPEVLARYRVHSGSTSANKLRAATAVWAILRREGLPLPMRTINFLRYATKSVRTRV